MKITINAILRNLVAIVRPKYDLKDRRMDYYLQIYCKYQGTVEARAAH